jgi:hypothetical protein
VKNPRKSITSLPYFLLLEILALVECQFIPQFIPAVKEKFHKSSSNLQNLEAGHPEGVELLQLIENARLFTAAKGYSSVN